VTDVTISDNGDASRYEVHVDGDLAGFAQYQRRKDQIIFTHTEIDPALEGRGIGGRLAKYALDDARSRSLRVVPDCPFIAAYIKSHPEYAEVVG
jgi:predicted GNAT family acetyltransferase